MEFTIDGLPARILKLVFGVPVAAVAWLLIDVGDAVLLFVGALLGIVGVATCVSAFTDDEIRLRVGSSPEGRQDFE